MFQWKWYVLVYSSFLTVHVNSNEAPLPWRWLAIESLQSLNFSTESDVWSYGITLWEMFTLGHVPYPGKNWDDDFLAFLSDGHRLTKPTYATSDCFDLMFECWKEIPSERILFSDLKMKLAEILDSFSYFTGHDFYNKEKIYMNLSL